MYFSKKKKKVSMTASLLLLLLLFGWQGDTDYIWGTMCIASQS